MLGVSLVGRISPQSPKPSSRGGNDMAPTNLEVAVLTTKVEALERDIKAVKDQIQSLDTKMNKVLQYMSAEEGKRSERDKIQQAHDTQMEINWTKVMGIAAIAQIVTATIGLVGWHVIMTLGK
jgi:hypothetical protein